MGFGKMFARRLLLEYILYLPGLNGICCTRGCRCRLRGFDSFSSSFDLCENSQTGSTPPSIANQPWGLGKEMVNITSVNTIKLLIINYVVVRHASFYRIHKSHHTNVIEWQSDSSTLYKCTVVKLSKLIGRFLLRRCGVWDQNAGPRTHPGTGDDVILVWPAELTLLQHADVPPLGQLLLPLGLSDL